MPRSSTGVPARGLSSTRSCLQVRGAKGWETRLVADNSHADRHVDEHHCHRYLEGQKQPAEPLPFSIADTNDAMAKVIDWFAENWTELTS